MAKFSGIIGFSTKSTDDGYGVYTPKITEKRYRGDILRDYKKWDSAETLNDDLSLNNTISVVADLYAKNHLHEIKYVLWNGGCFKVQSIDLKFPRIELHIGGVYNGPRAEETQSSNDP